MCQNILSEHFGVGHWDLDDEPCSVPCHSTHNLALSSRIVPVYLKVSVETDTLGTCCDSGGQVWPWMP